jgi:ParB family chromosome partitioning protein
MNRKKSTILPVNRTKLKNVALFEEEKEAKSSLPSVVFLEQIVLPKSQPRRYFDSEKLERLTQSVTEHGILEPLLIRPLANAQYELVAGERRYRAAVAAQLNSVPVVVKELDDTQALQLSLQENLQREDLNPVEETEGILQLIAIRENIAIDEVISRLYRMYNEIKGNVNSSNPNVRVNEFEHSVKAIFDSLGRMNWESFVKNKLPLLKLAEDVLEALRSGQIEYTKAKAIARLTDKETRKQLLEDAIVSSLSLSQIRELIKAEQVPKQQSELKTRFDTTYKQAKKAKKLWSDAKKRKQLESLLAKLEKLIAEDK